MHPLMELLARLREKAVPHRPVEIKKFTGGTTLILINSDNLRSTGRFIIESATQALKRITQLIPLQDAIFVIQEDNRINNQWGIYGYTPNPELAYIYLNFFHIRKNSLQEIQEKFMADIGHEGHHIARSQHLGPETYLYQLLVREGLAIHFEDEVIGSRVPQHYDRWGRELYARLLTQVGADLYKEDAYNKWFRFGSEKENIPRGSGYLLGYQIVKNYLQRNPGVTASQLYATKAESIWQPYQP